MATGNQQPPSQVNPAISFRESPVQGRLGFSDPPSAPFPQHGLPVEGPAELPEPAESLSAGWQGAAECAPVSNPGSADPATAQLCTDTQPTEPVVPAPTAAAQAAPHAGVGNRSQGSDGTAAHVSADIEARGCEEVDTGAAAPVALTTRAQSARQKAAAEDGPPGVPPQASGQNSLLDMGQMPVTVPTGPAPAGTSVATDRAVGALHEISHPCTCLCLDI